MVEVINQLFLEPLAAPFMQRGLVAAILIGVVSGVVGVYVVTRGMAFLGDALAHSVLPGVAVAFLTGGNNTSALLVGGMVAGVLSALGIGFLTRGERLAEDTAIGIVFAGTLALGIAIISKAQNYSVDLAHILVGNILTVSPEDLDFTAKVGLLVLLIIFALYKEFLLVSFDTMLARTLRLPGEALRLILLIVLAVTIVTGIQLVGVAMVAALLVTPAATARFFTGQLHRMMILSALIGAFSGVVGIYLAWHVRVAASAAIVLTMTALFLLAFLFAPGKGYLWSLLGRSVHTA